MQRPQLTCIYVVFLIACCNLTLSLSMVVETPARFAGFDLGTSGVRISIIETAPAPSGSDYREIYSKALTWENYDDSKAWMTGVEDLFNSASNEIDLKSILSICISGTSASCLLIDSDSQQVTRAPRMYDYDILARATDPTSATTAIGIIQQNAPSKHTARAASGSLAKLVAWAIESPLETNEVLCHQSDYISMMLTGQSLPMRSDWHNCLKLGYDVRRREWPEWFIQTLKDAGISDPIGQGNIPLEVVSPGQPVGRIADDVADRLGLHPDTKIVGGTTDSNAAFFAAAGIHASYGTAVTSLGSTLATKQLSKTYVEDADRGVYSHRFPNFQNPNDEAWLVGGASNVGCAIFRQLNFSNEELSQLSSKIDPTEDSPLTFYPLTKIGERFPVADSEKQPLLDPVPDSRQEYLHGLLQSIGDVEREGFSVLQSLGAPPPTVVYTCGGGSKNNVWTHMRERRLQVHFDNSNIHVQQADCTEASFGAALLAAATFA